jgi:hypothetical protein
MAKFPDPPRPTVQCIVDAASSAVALAFRDSGETVDIVPIIAALHREHPDFKVSEIKAHVMWELLFDGGKVKGSKSTAPQ